MIIMIDDNKDLNSITCKLLSILGYDVVSALSGQEGIDKAREKKPKVILSDIGMPGIDGYDLAKIIRQDAYLKDIYLIAISGYSSQSDIDRSIEAGFDKHIGKPIDIQVLKKILDEVFSS
ncbi:response regulator [Tissierella creatinini]|nr:response regulator [Tissierella creatinini]TJX65302.1 response regulator [Soehngenia saccharolytica]